MTNLLEFKLTDDDKSESVFIQIAESDSRNRGDDDEMPAQRSFTEAIRCIAPVGNALLNSLKEINTPDEINLEFGFSFTGKAGVVFTSLESAASFKVSIKWKNNNSD